MDKAWFTNQFISGSSQNKVVANDSWFTVNSAFMYQLLDCCTILVDAYLSVKQQVFNFIGQVSFYPKFIRQTQKSVLCWTNIGSTQINIANMRVLKTSKPTCRSIILWYTMGSLILLGIILCRFNQDNIFFDTEICYQWSQWSTIKFVVTMIISLCWCLSNEILEKWFETNIDESTVI